MSAVRNGSVFIIGSGRAVKRKVKTGATMTLSTGAPGVRVEEGLIGGEDLDRGSSCGSERRGQGEGQR